MKIKFFLSDNEMAPTTISGRIFAKSLIKRGYNVEIVNEYKRKIDIINKQDADIIIFQKKVFKGHQYSDIVTLKGKVFLCHIDDDFEGMDREELRKTLEITDLVLVCNEYHKDKLQKHINTNIEVITTISDFENYPFTSITEKNNNPLIVSWQQNLADVYIEDLKTVVKPLTDIYIKYGIELRLYGWHEGKDYGIPDRRKIIKDLLPFAKCISFQPYELYLKNIIPEISLSDIGILPYANIEQRYCKSSYCLRRMMMIGVPMVASNSGNNRIMLQDGISGFLAQGDEEWYLKLEQLILSKEKRERFAIQARNLLELEYSYDKTVELFINSINKYYILTK